MLLKQESISTKGTEFPEHFPRRLSAVQKRILRTILENRRTDELDHGLTSYDLRKLGIPGRTFDINRDFLLDNQLIEKKSEKKAGKQIRKQYGITTTGVFCLFCSSDSSEIDYLIPRLSNYIPKLTTNWNKLKKTFGDMLVEIFSQSIYNLNLDYFDIGLNRDGNKMVLGFWLIINFPTKDQRIDLTIRKLLVLSQSEFANKKNIETFTDINKLGIRLLNILVFMFYFIILHPEMYEIYKSELMRKFALNYIKSHRGDKINEERQAIKKHQEKLDNISNEGMLEVNKIFKNDLELNTLYHSIKNELIKTISKATIGLNY